MRYVTRRFIYDYAPEIAKVYTHTTQLDQEDVHMEIWDTTGQFQVRRILTAYFSNLETWQLLLQSQAELRHLEVLVRWADVILLVYSITDKASFHLAVQLLQQVTMDFLREQYAGVKCCTELSAHNKAFTLLNTCHPPFFSFM